MTGDVGTRTLVLRALDTWAAQGWIRRLDAALARFVADLSPGADGIVLLATAVVAHLEGQGHTCLVVDEFLEGGGRGLRWGADAHAALNELLAVVPATNDAWCDALRACDAVAIDAGDRTVDDGGEPLVFGNGRLYLRRYWRYERCVADAVRVRSALQVAVDEPAARAGLDRLFPAASDGSLDWQKVACAIALRGRLSIVTGGPGTGKTFTAARFLALLYALAPEPGRLRVALAAPTGKAAARLKQSIDAGLATLPEEGRFRRPIAEARTLHALLGSRPGTRRFRHDAANPLDVDVVIVDEASMIHIEMMDALLAALPSTARLLLLGDKDQLASVEAGAVLGELCRDADRPRYTDDTMRHVEALTGLVLPAADRDPTGSRLAQRTVMLRQSQRFSGAIGALAAAVNAGDGDAAAALLAARGDGAVAWLRATGADAVPGLAADGRAGAVGGYRIYLDALRRRPRGAHEQDGWTRAVLAAFERFRVLCAVRDGEWGVDGLNRAIAQRLAADGLLVAAGEWYEGRPVVVTRNDYGLGVFNGDIGIALRVAPHHAPQSPDLRVHFAVGSDVRSVGVGRLGHVETAFAMTVHKSQGSEFDHTVLVLPPDANAVTTRELVYTGVTRARSAFTLVSAGGDVLAGALAQTTARSSGLLAFIDR